MANKNILVLGNVGTIDQAHRLLDVAAGEKIHGEAIEISKRQGNTLVVDADTGALFAGGGGGSSDVSAFTDLSDTPSSYAGQTGKTLVVNGSENGLVYGEPVQGPQGDQGPRGFTGPAGPSPVMTATVSQGELDVEVTETSTDPVTYNTHFTIPPAEAAPEDLVSTDADNAIVIGDDGNLFVEDKEVMPPAPAEPTDATYGAHGSQWVNLDNKYRPLFGGEHPTSYQVLTDSADTELAINASSAQAIRWDLATAGVVSIDAGENLYAKVTLLHIQNVSTSQENLAVAWTLQPTGTVPMQWLNGDTPPAELVYEQSLIVAILVSNGVVIGNLLFDSANAQV